ncbi:trypsin-like peptidase domain-containing protein [Novosphingobium sp. YJ-S2-02]|uniref:Trypsin-like peptidase domain-containing protein n=1 Tax=Novosphingobium aureum TaxID=2792964 RepID=A0A931MJA8_9SPHN|nr:trypsin-like peptidase domain-containing protein [Novosphingobium aureum]MBH0111622.1 trypsin-like peptidase domain-containing protein [Novosphingobium aureum]
MTAPDDAALANMAAAITMPRAELEILYDELAGKHGSRIFKITTLLSPLATPYLEALKTARGDNWFDELAERLVLADAFRDPTAAVPVPAPAAVQVQLQGIVQPQLGLLAAGLLHIGTITALRRVCWIGIDGDPPSGGTGFLVGPQAVLTARHVVQPLLDNAGLPLAGSAQHLSVVFDAVGRYSQRRQCGVPEAWLIDTSDCHDLERSAALAAQFDAADPESFRDRLDYAIVRLDKPVGRERGFYRLDNQRLPSVGPGGGQIMLFQHPKGDQMHAGNGAGLALWPAAVETRLRHSANALDGSSGGLILDKTFNPVAMHQCTFKDDTGVALMNGAVPTACIAGRARPDIIEQVIGLDPIWRIAASGEPVVGRELFQASVMNALSGMARIIVVRGAPDSGKTFSTSILRTMLDESSNAILAFSASALPLEARRFAQQLIEAMRLSPTQLPDDEPDTAPEAWARDHLLPAVLQALRDFAGARLVWLVLDDLDSHPVAAGSTTSMLERLFSDIASYPFLRLVLIGQRGQVPAAKPLTTIYDDITPFNRQEVEDYLSRKYVSEGIMKNQDEIETLAEFVMNWANNAGSPLVEAVARALLTGAGLPTGQP